jgi:hypothetical protein
MQIESRSLFLNKMGARDIINIIIVRIILIFISKVESELKNIPFFSQPPRSVGFAEIEFLINFYINLHHSTVINPYYGLFFYFCLLILVFTPHPNPLLVKEREFLSKKSRPKNGGTFGGAAAKPPRYRFGFSFFPPQEFNTSVLYQNLEHEAKNSGFSSAFQYYSFCFYFLSIFSKYNSFNFPEDYSGPKPVFSCVFPFFFV